MHSSHGIGPAATPDECDADEEAGVVANSADSLVEEELDNGVLHVQFLLDCYALFKIK